MSTLSSKIDDQINCIQGVSAANLGRAFLGPTYKEKSPEMFPIPGAGCLNYVYFLFYFRHEHYDVVLRHLLLSPTKSF